MNISSLLCRTQKILLPLTAAAVAYELFLVFLVVPNERLMGPVQRLFYFHVGSAIAVYVACALQLVGALGYLASRRKEFDLLNQAGGETGLLFCSITLFSGMIWGHSAWNTWFRWEPRLVTLLLLWFIFLGFHLLRRFGDRARIAPHCAVLAIVGAVMVPIVVFSVKLLPHVAQLHPQVVENRGLRDPLFELAMFAGMGALVLLQLLLTVVRLRIGVAEEATLL